MSKKNAQTKARLGRREAIALAAGLLALTGLAVLAPRRAPAPRPDPRPAAKPEKPPTPAPAEIASSRAPSGPPAPAHYSLSAGLSPERGPRCDVNVETGRVTFFERDVELEGFSLVRARASDDTRTGIFGAGWRSDLEARVVPGEPLVVERLQGATTFEARSEGLYESTTGEVEVLRRVPSGFELAAAGGVTYRFSRTGEVTAIEGASFAVTIARSPERILVRDASFATLRLTLDGRGRVSRAEGPAGLTYGYEGDELVSISGAAKRGYVAASGRLTRVTDEKGAVLAATYGAEGRVASLEDPVSRLVRSYKIAGRVMTVSDREGTLTFTLDAKGRDLRVLERDGTTEHVTFDERGRIASREVPGQGRRVFTYGPDGKLAGYEDANGKHAVGAAVSPGLAVEPEAFTYDAQGQPASRTDPEGRTSRFERDGDGRVALVHGPTGAIRVTRDASGRVSGLVTPGGRVWSETHEGTTDTVAGAWGTVRFEHDALGRLSRRTDESGLDTTFTYDALGRIVGTKPARGPEVTSTFDAAGRLTGARAGESALTFGYDAEGRIETATDGGVSLHYVFDVPTRTMRTIAPWGEVARTFDGEGRLESLTTPAGVFGFGRDASGLVLRAPNGVTTRRTLDAKGHTATVVVAKDGASILDLELGRDERGQRTFTRRGSVTTPLAFDAAGRLVTAGEHEIAWDADGNRTRDGGETVVCDARGWLVSKGKETFDHDKSGRITARHHAAGTDRFDYDAFGRLVQVARAGKSAVGYRYDALGRVATRTASGETTRFFYDGSHRVAEIGASGVRRTYVFGPGLDQPLACCEGGTWTFFHANDSGSVLSYTDAAGKEIASCDLDPWGHARELPGRLPVVYAGRFFDAEAGLYDLRARFYDPVLGRFLTPDPSGPEGGLNGFAYTDGNPLDYGDPLGLQQAPQGAPTESLTDVLLGRQNAVNVPAALSWLSLPRPVLTFFAKAIVSGALSTAKQQIQTTYIQKKRDAKLVVGGVADLVGLSKEPVDGAARMRKDLGGELVVDVATGKSRDRSLGYANQYGKWLADMSLKPAFSQVRKNLEEIDQLVGWWTLGKKQSHLARALDFLLEPHLELLAGDAGAFAEGTVYGKVATTVSDLVMLVDGAASAAPKIPGVARRIGRAAGLGPEIEGLLARLGAEPEGAIAAAAPRPVVETAPPVHRRGARGALLGEAEGEAEVARAVAPAPKVRVEKSIPGYYESYPTEGNVPEGMTLEDTECQDGDYRVIQTDVRRPETGESTSPFFIRAYDAKTGTLEMRYAFSKDLPTWVKGKNMPLVADQGSPVQTFFTIRQMRKLGVPYGSLKQVRMKQIQNADALITLEELVRGTPERPPLPIEEALLETASVKYATTPLTQSGHRMVKGSARIDCTRAYREPISKTLNYQVERGIITSEQSAKLAARHGADYEVLTDFDIIIDLEPSGD